MDYVDIKPVGVYGSKNELIRFLKQLNVIDYYTYAYNFFYCLEIIAEKRKAKHYFAKNMTYQGLNQRCVPDCMVSLWKLTPRATVASILSSGLKRRRGMTMRALPSAKIGQHS